MMLKLLFSLFLISTMMVLVVSSWMLSPRNLLFGPSLLDSMIVSTPTFPMIRTLPSPSPSSSLLRTWIDETNQLLLQQQQQMMSSFTTTVPYEYQNYDHNITIRIPVPSNIPIEQVNVQYDDNNQLLTISGSTSTKTTNDNDTGASNKDVNGGNTDKKDETTLKNTVTRHYEFQQSFYMDPDLVHVDQVSAQLEHSDNNNGGTPTITIVVPKQQPAAIESNTKNHIRSIPIKMTSPATPSLTNGDHHQNDATTTTTEKIETPVAAH